MVLRITDVVLRSYWDRRAVDGILSLQVERARGFMTDYLELPVGPKSPEVINVVIEIPADGVNKYEYDKDLHVFRLDRNLYSPVHYPGDYGFIPSTPGR